MSVRFAYAKKQRSREAALSVHSWEGNVLGVSTAPCKPSMLYLKSTGEEFN